MSDRLQELTVFVRAAETGSFSKAGRELGLSQPSISRIVNDLEARLGVRLLLRTTRQVTPTDAGIAFLERARQVIHDLEAAEDVARGIDSLRGQLRVALPVTFGLREVIPRLPGFLQRYPCLRLDLLMTDDRQDLVAERVDVAIRLGELAASAFGARRLATAPRLMIASPAYLAARGAPRTPADLAGHYLVCGGGPGSRRSWRFTRHGAAVSVEVESRIQCSTGEGVMACIRAGQGVGMASLWMCRTELETGAVVPVLEGYDLETAVVHAVFPGGPRPSAKVRALVDYLAAELSR
ncbi:MAG: LysR family transcriptional regulator [Caulobacteraceae bacterium]